MGKGGEGRRKGCVSRKGAKQIGMGSSTGNSWKEIPTIWTVLVLWGRGCFRAVGSSIESVAPGLEKKKKVWLQGQLGPEEINSQSGEMFLQAN